MKKTLLLAPLLFLLTAALLPALSWQGAWGETSVRTKLGPSSLEIPEYDWKVSSWLTWTPIGIKVKVKDIQESEVSSTLVGTNTSALASEWSKKAPLYLALFLLVYFLLATLVYLFLLKKEVIAWKAALLFLLPPLLCILIGLLSFSLDRTIYSSGDGYQLRQLIEIARSGFSL